MVGPFITKDHWENTLDIKGLCIRVYLIVHLNIIMYHIAGMFGKLPSQNWLAKKSLATQP